MPKPDEPRKNPDELGALWEKTNDRGVYMTGTIGTEKVVCFRNDRKTRESQPDWRILKSKPRGDRDKEVDKHPPAVWGRNHEDPDGL